MPITLKEIEKHCLELVQYTGGLGEQEVKKEHRFVEDLGFDSLDKVELIIKLEEKFYIRIQDEEAESVKTYGDLLKYLEKKLLK